MYDVLTRRLSSRLTNKCTFRRMDWWIHNLHNIRLNASEMCQHTTKTRFSEYRSVTVYIDRFYCVTFINEYDIHYIDLLCYVVMMYFTYT